MLQPPRHLARRRQNKGIRPLRMRLEHTEIAVADTRILRELRKIATHEREVMVLIETPNTTNPLHRPLVPDVATEHVARIGRIHHEPTAAENINRAFD